MTEIKTFEDFKKYIAQAYKNSNFFDSQHEIEELKKTYSEKQILAFIRKEIDIRKKTDELKESELRKIEQKYKETKTWLWEEALNYVTHKYQVGEFVFCYSGNGFNSYKNIDCGKITKLTKRGYKIFFGRKLGIEPEVTFANIICEASNTKRILEEIQKQESVKA